MTRRFEIRGIRTWGHRRRRAAGAVHTASGSGNGAGELADILARYDEQRAERSERELTAAERHERFREESRKLIDTVLAPTLRSLGEEIVGHGHGWAVEERIDIQAQPGIACAFIPENKHVLDGRTTELSFRFQFPDRLAVMGAIPNGKGMRDLPARSYPTSKLDGLLVRKEAARFVAAVLGDS